MTQLLTKVTAAAAGFVHALMLYFNHSSEGIVILKETFVPLSQTNPWHNAGWSLLYFMYGSQSNIATRFVLFEYMYVRFVPSDCPLPFMITSIDRPFFWPGGATVCRGDIVDCRYRAAPDFSKFEPPGGNITKKSTTYWCAFGRGRPLSHRRRHACPCLFLSTYRRSGIQKANPGIFGFVSGRSSWSSEMFCILSQSKIGASSEVMIGQGCM